MKVLVIGSGGREHSLVWKLAQSPRVTELFCAPGNAGIAALATCVPLRADDLPGLLAFAVENQIDLTVVGPEAPLVAGIADQFATAGLPIFGPTAAAARLEGSKVFAKELMAKYSIPTGSYRAFADAATAKAHLAEQAMPCVIKVDGLAAGKGVVIAHQLDEASRAVDELWAEHGGPQQQLLIEEFLVGEEVTVMAFADGQTVRPMVWAQDHKRVFDNDQGPNTGGMGAYSPTGLETPALREEILQKILQPTVLGMAQEGHPFKGVLYAGLMLTAAGPKVLEYNVRFGDPECQVVLPRLASDLFTIMHRVTDGTLAEANIQWNDDAAACVILASGGYPGAFTKGFPISGLATAAPEVTVFHSGTARENGQIVTGGGRVLGISALGATLAEAVKKAYARAEQIDFANRHFRKDIAWRAFQRRHSR